MLAFLRQYRRRDHSRGRESFAFFATGGARSFALRRLRAHGSFQPELFPADQEDALSDHARPARALLVSAATANCRGARDAINAWCRRFGSKPNIANADRERAARAFSSAKFCRITFAVAAGLARRRGRFAQCESRKRFRFRAKQTRRAIWFLEVNYLEGATENYALPVQIASGAAANAVLRAMRRKRSLRGSAGDARFVLHDAVWDNRFREELFRAMATAAMLARQARRTLRRRRRSSRRA